MYILKINSYRSYLVNQAKEGEETISKSRYAITPGTNSSRKNNYDIIKIIIIIYWVISICQTLL